MFRPFIYILLCIVLLGCASCGYHFGGGGQLAQYHSISVPYIEGDLDGQFTTILIRELSSAGELAYRRSGGDLILKVKLLDFREENIGYRYDRNKENERKQNIIPVETRLFVYAEVALIDATTGCPIKGPVKLASNMEFDHDYYSSRNGVNIFSLGQLIDYDEAYDAALTPLAYVLAQKIVDFIYDS